MVTDASHCAMIRGSFPGEPADEPARLEALRGLHLLDTQAEERFDRITRLVAKLYNVPIAYVSLVDENRQWFKSRVGLPMTETRRNISFCDHAILQEDPLIIADATLDIRFKDYPHVTGEPHVRFYAGRPLRTPDQFKVGTLCIMDLQPRTLDERELELFNEFADLVERELSLTETIGFQLETLRVKEELIERQRDLARLYTELEREREKSEDLLLNILPKSVADELKATGRVQAVHYPCASVLFADFVDFTRLSGNLTPQELVDELHLCFSAFDEIVVKHNVEKLKTIGDGYLCVAGIPGRCSQHARDIIDAALEIREFIEQRREQIGPKHYWSVRIGIHTGPVVAGVVGLNKFAYDIWGDTVNTAARLENASAAGKITISRETHDQVRGVFACQSRGFIDAKGKGAVEMFFVDGRE